MNKENATFQVYVGPANPDQGYTNNQGYNTWTSGTRHTLTATPYSGYVFDHWVNRWSGGTATYTSQSITITVDREESWLAYFTQQVQRYTINTYATAGGTATGGGTYNRGATATITATPSSYYLFNYWALEGGGQITSNPYSFQVYSNASYTAVFTRPNYTISVYKSTGGEVSGGGNYARGENATITAIPDEGYRFAYWVLEGGGEVTTNPYTFQVFNNASYTAVFIRQYTLTLHHTPGGIVTGQGKYDRGAYATMYAYADSGYEFQKWVDDRGSTVSTNYVFTYQMYADTEFTAVFVEIPKYNVTLFKSPNEGGVVTGDGIHLRGSEVTITATANQGYKFYRWVDNTGALVTENSTYTFTIYSDSEFTALFVPTSTLFLEIRARKVDGSTVPSARGVAGMLNTSIYNFNWSGSNYTRGIVIEGILKVTYNHPSGYILREIVTDGGRIGDWNFYGTYATASIGGDSRITLIYEEPEPIIERLSATYPTDIKYSPYYIGTNKGGFNKFNGKFNPLDDPSIIGNCTWYANGRTQEIAGQDLGNKFPNLGNAGSWFSNQACDWDREGYFNPKDGLGSVINLYPGDILCWCRVDSEGNPIILEDGSTPGHVEIIEKIENGIVTISYSDYSLTYFGTYSRDIGTFVVGAGYPRTKSGQPLTTLQLQGVIHNPYRSSPKTTFKITALSNDSTKGFVTGGGLYNRGDIAILHAYPRGDYEFLHWDYPNPLGGDTLEIPVYSDMIITAFFGTNGGIVIPVLATIIGNVVDVIVGVDDIKRIIIKKR